MLPLVILSIVAWIVCVERALTLKKWKEKNREFLLSFQNYWLKGDRDAATKLCEKSNVELSELASILLTQTGANILSDKNVARLDRRKLEQAADLKKNLWILGTIGSATPFIGLFGTVIGIIKAFESISEAGAGGFNVVASGISEALVATAGGIVVAVIAVFFYNYFTVRVAQLQFQLGLLAEELLEVFDDVN